MSERNLAAAIEQDQVIVDPPVVQQEAMRPMVSAQVRQAPAANEASLRKARRRVRTIVWDDGGLKPFRLA